MLPHQAMPMREEAQRVGWFSHVVHQIRNKLRYPPSGGKDSYKHATITMTSRSPKRATYPVSVSIIVLESSPCTETIFGHQCSTCCFQLHILVCVSANELVL